MLSGNDHASSIRIKMKFIIIVVSFNMLFEEKILITKSTKRSKTIAIRDINNYGVYNYCTEFILSAQWYTKIYCTCIRKIATDWEDL